MKNKINLETLEKSEMDKIILTIILSISLAMLSLYLMIGNVTKELMLITFCVSFIFCNIYIYTRYEDIINMFKSNKKCCYILLILSLIIFYEFKTIGVENIKYVNELIGSIRHFHYLSLPGIIFIITIIFIKIKDWINKFINDMDFFEKRAYMVTSLLMLVILFFVYLKSNYFYTQYDKVYSMDSGWIMNNLVSKPHYYDIRHPLLSLLTFPVYAIVDFIFSESLKPIILQFINVQLLILIGLELKRITNNKIVYVFYIISFPTILFSLFFEKYVICVFLMVSYIYNIFVNKKDSNELLVLNVGCLPTNIFICFAEFFRYNKFKEKIKNIFNIALIALLIIILTGRIHCLFNGYNEMVQAKNVFGNSMYYTIRGKLNSITKVIHNSFVYIPSSEQNGVYWWNDIMNSPSYLGIIFLIIIVFAIFNIIKNKKKMYYPFLLALFFSFVLFVGLSWSVHESPLFAICFSWAIIPLFIFGLDKIFNLFKLKEQVIKKIYYILLILTLIVNILCIIDIYKFTLLIKI